MRSISFLCCVLSLSLPLPLLAADKVALQLHLQQGNSWTFDQTQDMTSENKATANGQTQPYTSKMHSRRIGKAEVLAAKNGEPTSIRFTFDDGCESSMAMGAQSQNFPFPYAGKAVTVTRGDDGTVSDDFNGQADPSSVSELHAMIVQEQVIFPSQPVAVGEEWKADPKILAQVAGLQGADDRAGMTLKLLGTGSDNGHPTAQIKVSIAIQRGMHGMSSTVILQGTADIDLTTGHTFKTDMKGTTESKGEQQGPGPGGTPVAYKIEGSGTMTTTVAAPLTGSSGEPAPAPTPAPPVAGGPAVNPLAPPPTAPFAGKFTDGKLTVELTESNGSYGGTIMLGDQKFPSTGRANGQKIDGNFQAGGNSFPFNGTLDGDTLTFTTGGKTYTLKKESTAVNPLGGGAPQPANPLAPGATNSPAQNNFATNAAPADTAAHGAVPSGYSVVSTTDAGKALSARKPAANSVANALQSTLPDLAHYFDGKPTIVSAYEDSRDHRGGGASFTAKLQGQPVKGLVSCKLDEKDSTIAVIYAKSDATSADWNKLTATPAAAGGAPSVPALHTYNFPDGTGSIGLAQGWTTKATSCHGMVVIEGPADQAVTLGFNLSAVTPTSTAVRMNQQLNAQARQLGGKQMPMTLYVAPFSGPVDALNNLMPQVSAKSQQNKGPTLSVDHLKQIREIAPILQGGKAAVCEYGLTITKDGHPRHHRVMAQVEVDPIGADSFMFALAAAAAPDATFKNDLPTMLAMMSSIRENAAVIQQQTREQIDAMNRRFAAQQKANAEVQAAYDDYNKDMARNSVIRSRSNDDFDEVIRGYRTVEDTQTGTKTSVDLGNVDKIVDNLNYYDPGRYKQIPLRDEADPLPPGP